MTTVGGGDFWRLLGEADVAPLALWLASGGAKWPPVKGGQPNRVRLPAEAHCVVAAVMTYFDHWHTYDRGRACLSRLVPGSTYEFHRDPQPPGWVTRVHVPVVTNPAAWLQFEGREPVHFEAGRIYTFDALAPHRYGNDGDADRVHLILDVMEE